MKKACYKNLRFFHIPSEFAKKALYCLHDSGLFYCDDKYIVERKNYNNFLIMLIRKGSMTIKYRDQEFQARKNTLVFLNCHEPHTYLANEDVFFEWFHFSGIASHPYFDFLLRKVDAFFQSRIILSFQNVWSRFSKWPKRGISMSILFR